MKNISTLLAAIMIVATPVFAHDMDMSSHHMNMMHQGMHGMMSQGDDSRTSLGLAPAMKQQQLANMRSHVEAVHDIIGLLAEDKFDEASGIAHNKLGLTPEMKKMCNMFANADFKKLGLAFHKQADELGDVLKTGNMKRSLVALHKTMNSCVQCHATFRQ